MQDDKIFVAINLQGIQILANSRRERIVHHVDYEDVLYVMGKGDRLRLAFTYLLPGSRLPTDCCLEFLMEPRAGLKARSVAEDIISYAQLRLVEMSKNNQVEFLSRFHSHNYLEKKEHDQAPGGNLRAWQTQGAAEDDEAEQHLESQEDKHKGAAATKRSEQS